MTDDQVDTGDKRATFTVTFTIASVWTGLPALATRVRRLSSFRCLG